MSIIGLNRKLTVQCVDRCSHLIVCMSVVGRKSLRFVIFAEQGTLRTSTLINIELLIQYEVIAGPKLLDPMFHVIS